MPGWSVRRASLAATGRLPAPGREAAATDVVPGRPLRPGNPNTAPRCGSRTRSVGSSAQEEPDRQACIGQTWEVRMRGESTKVTGSCLCGTIRYEAEVYLKDAYYCHCRMCQRTSGAPAEIAVYVKPGTLRFMSEQPKFYRSSSFAERGFCQQCGDRFIYRQLSPDLADYSYLVVGC